MNKYEVKTTYKTEIFFAESMRKNKNSVTFKNVRLFNPSQETPDYTKVKYYRFLSVKRILIEK